MARSVPMGTCVGESHQEYVVWGLAWMDGFIKMQQ